MALLALAVSEEEEKGEAQVVRNKRHSHFLQPIPIFHLIYAFDKFPFSCIYFGLPWSATWNISSYSKVYGYVDFVRESTVQGIHILYVTHNYDPVYLHV